MTTLIIGSKLKRLLQFLSLKVGTQQQQKQLLNFCQLPSSPLQPILLLLLLLMSPSCIDFGFPRYVFFFFPYVLFPCVLLSLLLFLYLVPCHLLLLCISQNSSPGLSALSPPPALPPPPAHALSPLPPSTPVPNFSQQLPPTLRERRRGGTNQDNFTFQTPRDPQSSGS